MSEFTFIEQTPNQGAEHAVESGNTIGREGCDITIADPDVSRRHAAIRIVGDELSIEDLGSTNGTLVNGEAITMRRSLRDGDEVQIGSTVWRLRAPAGATRLRDVPTPAPSQATTLRPAAPAPAEPPASEPRAPEPVTAEVPPAPVSKPAAPEPPVAKPAPSRRGDVPQPDFAPSGIRRIVPVDVPTAFTPEASGGRKGSAATRAGATAMATVVVALTTVGVVLYYITEPFK
jgi:predicted component of type VI protein secretion system